MDRMLNHITAVRFLTFEQVVQLSTLHPFRLLLYVEWLLLGLAIFTLFLPLPPYLSAQISPSSLLCVMGFGILGLPLAKAKLSHKIVYLLLEFGLLFLPMLLDNRNQAFPFLTILLVIRSCQMFKLRECLIILVLAFTSFALHLTRESQQVAKLLQSLQSSSSNQNLLSSDNILLIRLGGTISFGFMLLALMMLVNSLLSVHQSRQQLTIAHEQLRQYALRIESQATLQERNRIAREIHDSLGHVLTAQSIQLENALIFCPPDAQKTQGFLSQSRQLCSKALQEVRQSVATLRSLPSLEQSLEKLIHVAVQEFQQISEIAVNCSIFTNQTVPAEVNIMIYRIIQEALINVYKHSAASEVQIHLQATTDHLAISISDNGRGFDPNYNQTGFGLQGMQERAAVFNGKLHLISQPGQGCKVVILIPL
jgi:signal transduction histidine kinase